MVTKIKVSYSSAAVKWNEASLSNIKSHRLCFLVAMSPNFEFFSAELLRARLFFYKNIDHSRIFPQPLHLTRYKLSLKSRQIRRRCYLRSHANTSINKP